MPNILFSADSRMMRQDLPQNGALRCMLDVDWSHTGIGSFVDWPESLKTMARFVLSASTPFALLVGPHGILIYNDAIKAIFAREGAESLGRPVFEVLPDDADFYRRVMAACAAGHPPSFRDRILMIAGNGGTEPAWFDLDFTPVMEKDGSHHAILMGAFNTTEKVRALRARDRTDEQLHVALDASGMIGIWNYDIRTGRVHTDERFLKLFGIEGPALPEGLPLSIFSERFHEEDRDRVATEIEDAIRTGADFRSKYRVTDTSGILHWVLASGHVLQDAEGNPVRFPGVAVDVTAQVEADAALVESEARFRTLAEAIPQNIWSADAEGRHDYFSSRWYDYTGLDPATAEEEAWQSLVHPDDIDRVWRVWNKARETGERYEIEYRFRHHSGEYRWFLVLALPQRDATGAIRRWFGTATDIHASKLVAVEREVIAQELHHRIKNMFSITSALVNLSARSAQDVKSLASDLNGRIMALSAAHDLVRPTSGITPTTLHSLAQRVLNPYSGPDGPRLTCSGEDFPLSEGAATSFALIFHELATNAAKYGALSVADGGIGFTTRLDDGRILATWKETGGTTPDAASASARGFGSKLIALMIEGQKHGKVARHWEPDGLRIEFDIAARFLVPAS